MKADSGEIVNIPEGQKAEGFIPLTLKEKNQIEVYPPSERPMMLSWIRYIEKFEESHRVPIYEKVRMKDAFKSGWLAREGVK
jgi:hypothetical protein